MATEIMCQSCGKIFDIVEKILEVEQRYKPARNIDEIIEENEVFAKANCPKCGEENEIYYFKSVEFLSKRKPTISAKG